MQDEDRSPGSRPLQHPHPTHRLEVPSEETCLPQIMESNEHPVLGAGQEGASLE